MRRTYDNLVIPESKKVTCKICFIADNTGTWDMDGDIHKGFTIGKGKTLYWYIIWHKSGHCTVYRNAKGGLVKRYISGDQEITIHFH